MNFVSTRRGFAVRLASVLSALGLTAATGVTRGMAQSSQDSNAIRKLNGEGQPGSEKDVIMPVVMDKLKKMVEIGGATMDTVLQANVFLVKIEHWDGMHKVFATYFPYGGPARTTVAVAALPGDSLVEINCIAAVAHK